MLAIGQMVCLRPVGILNSFKFNLNYLFQAFYSAPTSINAINDAEDK